MNPCVLSILCKQVQEKFSCLIKYHLYLLFFLFLFVSWDRVLLCIPGQPQAWNNPPVLASGVSGSQVCTTPGWLYSLVPLIFTSDHGSVFLASFGSWELLKVRTLSLALPVPGVSMMKGKVLCLERVPSLFAGHSLLSWGKMQNRPSLPIHTSPSTQEHEAENYHKFQGLPGLQNMSYRPVLTSECDVVSKETKANNKIRLVPFYVWGSCWSDWAKTAVLNQNTRPRAESDTWTPGRRLRWASKQFPFT